MAFPAAPFGHMLLPRQAIAEKDENIGKATETNSSVSAMVSTLVTNLVIFAIMVSIFAVLRMYQKRFYMPKAYVSTVPEWKRKAAQTIDGKDGFLSWIGGIGRADDTAILQASGLDGYFFLRYLKKARMISVAGCLFVFPILFPINITGGGGQQGLDILSFSNCAKKERYWAHLFVGIFFFSFILYTVYRELIFYINLRQAYMFSPFYGPRISARTVLITCVPPEYMSESALRRVFDNVKRIWLNSDTEELEKLVKERDEVAMKLEAAEVKLIKLTDAARRKAGGSAADAADVDDGESGSVAAKWLERKKRPTHKTKFLVGETVDTIDWCRERLATLIPQVEEMQQKYRNGSDTQKFNSAFIEFTSQSTAQVAVQTLAYHLPLHMAPRYIGITPDEIVWRNMKIRWLERLVKFAATTAFVIALVIFWSIPVAVTALISQVDYLTERLPWLGFINDTPPVILGLITGLLPAVMLAILMALLPIVLRLMAKIAGAPSLSQIELRTQNSYFAFQVVQVFLVTTLASAASTAVSEIINNPTSAPGLLAQAIPKASNFYIAFMILQGLAISAGALLQLVGLIVFNLLGLILDNTPRKMFRRWSTLAGLGWGTVFPVYTNIAVIAITYSIISPLVMAFSTIGFTLLYFAYRNNLLFVYNTNIDTKGLVYPRALYQTLTGVYLAEIVLIGLFALKSAIGPAIIQLIFFIFTILFQLALSDAVDPLLRFLPKSLEDVEERLLSAENGEAGDVFPTAETKEGSSSLVPKPAAAAAALVGGQIKKVGFLARFLHPEKHADYLELRKLIPKDFPEIRYTPEEERDAYYHPAVTAKVPVLWVPKDEGGVSRQECKHTGEIIGCEDEGAVVDEKGKVRRNEEDTVPPGWAPDVVY
ncbi:phosphate metabolism protein [Kalaharituber pfeilii]|nr:phosphate metabolism protein [Kalaharituber pfeilii]